MLQWRLLELLNDHDLEFNYHDGKVNLAVDALSQKSNHFVAALGNSDDLTREFDKLNLENFNISWTLYRVNFRFLRKS